MDQNHIQKKSLNLNLISVGENDTIPTITFLWSIWS